MKFRKAEKSLMTEREGERVIKKGKQQWEIEKEKERRSD